MRLDLGLLRTSGAASAREPADRLAVQRRQLLRLIDTLALVLSLPLALQTLAAIERRDAQDLTGGLLWPQLLALLGLWGAGSALLVLRMERAAFASIFGLGHCVVLMQIWQSASVLPGALMLPALALGAVALPVGPLLAVLAAQAATLVAVGALHPSIGGGQIFAACVVLAAIALAFGTLGNRFRAMLGEVSHSAEQLQRAAAAQARNEQQLRLQEAQQQVLRHDLRSPCDILSGYVELMQHGALPPEQTAWTLQQVKLQALRLRMRVDALVDEAKAAGHGDWDALDIAALLRAQARDLQRLASTAPRDAASAPVLTVDVEGACLVRGRAQELQRVFENLVANSAAAGAGNIWISARVDRSVEITVKDNGPGYPPALLGSALKPSYADRPPGVGLGLVGVAANVAAFGGSIELSNWLLGTEGGACTTLRFPCA